jgi:hypothetical protein
MLKKLAKCVIFNILIYKYFHVFIAELTKL